MNSRQTFARALESAILCYPTLDVEVIRRTCEPYVKEARARFADGRLTNRGARRLAERARGELARRATRARTEHGNG